LERTLSRFDEALGLDVLHLIHLNDSLTPRASRTDRHAAVGRGAIGARGLARVVRHPAFSHLAGIMETPRETEQDDRDNMDRAKRWRRKS
jgi:endonuclease IV